ncbi:hypothetical protein MBLNU230_g6747t1 [Neophaeotheca triangularis]
MPPRTSNSTLHAKAALAKATTGSKPAPAKPKASKAKTVALSKDRITQSPEPSDEGASSKALGDAGMDSEAEATATAAVKKSFTPDDEGDWDGRFGSSKAASEAENESQDDEPATVGVKSGLVEDAEDVEADWNGRFGSDDEMAPVNVGLRHGESEDEAREEDEKEDSSEEEPASTFADNPFAQEEKEKAKPRSLNAKRRAAAEKKAAKLAADKTYSTGKPITTQQKIRKAEADKEAKKKGPKKANAKTAEKPKAAKKASPSSKGKKSTKGTAAEYSTPMSSVINALTSGAGAQVLSNAATVKNYADLMATWMAPFRLMELPAELRNRIWTFVVVKPATFVYPHVKTDQEQPDLAQVSRQVRSEVLPIFYGHNIFALSFSNVGQDAPNTTGVMTANGSTDIADQWAAALNRKGKLSANADPSVSQDWFGLMRHWAFWIGIEVSPPIATAPMLPRGSREIEECLITITFPTANERGAFCAVHSDAVCVLPIIFEHPEACNTKELPGWVKKILLRAGLGPEKCGSRVKRWQVAELSGAFQNNATALMHLKCEKVVASIEGGAVGE